MNCNIILEIWIAVLQLRIYIGILDCFNRFYIYDVIKEVEEVLKHKKSMKIKFRLQATLEKEVPEFDGRTEKKVEQNPFATKQAKKLRRQLFGVATGPRGSVRASHPLLAPGSNPGSAHLVLGTIDFANAVIGNVLS